MGATTVQQHDDLREHAGDTVAEETDTETETEPVIVHSQRSPNPSTNAVRMKCSIFVVGRSEKVALPSRLYLERKCHI